MTLSRWLNSLSGFEQFLLLILGVIAWVLSSYTLKLFFAWIYRKREKERFVTRFRRTPILIFIIAIPYFILFTTIVFRLISSLS